MLPPGEAPGTNFWLELVAGKLVLGLHPKKYVTSGLIWYRRVVATRPNTSENMAAPLVHMESRYRDREISTPGSPSGALLMV